MSVLGVQSPMNHSGQNGPKLLKTFSDGVAAYLFGYPLVLMGVTEQTSINAPMSSFTGAAPLNQFGKQTQFPDYTFNTVVLPSTSTLYASAFLNLKTEPIVLHIPDFKDRYFVMAMLDGWTNVNPNSPGKRIGSQSGKYAIVGPDYVGKLSDFADMQIIQMDTNTVWIVGRVFTTGTEADLAIVKNELYPRLTLTPWSKRNDPLYQPPHNLPVDPLVDVGLSPVVQLKSMDAAAFFGKLAAMMNYNPLVLPRDKAMQPVLEEIGFQFKPASDGSTSVAFDYSQLSSEKKECLQAATLAGRQFLEEEPDSDGPNNWILPTESYLGDYGVHYIERAKIARRAFGANLVQEVVYGYGLKDKHGHELKGEYNYKLRIAPLPPVSGFWSVTVYASDGTLVNNPTAVKAGVTYSAIGLPPVQGHEGVLDPSGNSMTLFLQSKPPDEKDSYAFRNWIPTPISGGFIVFLRMYIPGQPVLDGQWVPQAIERVA